MSTLKHQFIQTDSTSRYEEVAYGDTLEIAGNVQTSREVLESLLPDPNPWVRELAISSLRKQNHTRTIKY